MKYLYCPRCKELRVKPWYAIANKCQRCFGVATPINIPPNWMTYMTYVLYVVVPAMILVYVTNDDKTWLYASLVGLVIMFMLTFADQARGAAYARSKLKVAGSDLDDFRRRGWT